MPYAIKCKYCSMIRVRGLDRWGNQEEHSDVRDWMDAHVKWQHFPEWLKEQKEKHQQGQIGQEWYE